MVNDVMVDAAGERLVGHRAVNTRSACQTRWSRSGLRADARLPALGRERRGRPVQAGVDCGYLNESSNTDADLPGDDANVRVGEVRLRASGSVAARVCGW